MVFDVQDCEGHLWYISRALVFENLQRSDALLTFTNCVMSIAVEHERFILTANEWRGGSLTEVSVSGNLFLSGGNF